MALEGARFGITANIIAPGIIGTEAFKAGSPKMNDRMVLRTALRMAGEPEDIAHAICFLVSPEARYVTGQVLTVAGASTCSLLSDARMRRRSSDHVEVGVTYSPAAVGPYMWHEFPADTVMRDLAAIAARRVPVVRSCSGWDAFMPTDRAPNPRRMRELETLLGVARDLDLSVV